MQSPEHAEASVAAGSAGNGVAPAETGDGATGTRLSQATGGPFGRDWRTRADAIVALYPQPRSALMPLLHEAIRAEGYLSDGGMRQVANMLGLTPAQVASVATFYTMYKREPPGRYLISVCTSLPCMLLGSDDVLDAVERATGVTEGAIDPAGLFFVEHAECLGSCGGAPMLQVNYEFVESVTPEQAEAMCAYLRETRPDRADPFTLQERFGGTPSFEWGQPDDGGEGSPGPYPGFEPTAPPAERAGA